MREKIGSTGSAKELPNSFITKICLRTLQSLGAIRSAIRSRAPKNFVEDQRGDIPGWVLVVLMTTGLVTAIWTIAAPRLSSILRNSLDAMNAIR